MSQQTIKVPPSSGSISVKAGDTLQIHTQQACTFTCSIGGNFNPNLSSAQLSAGQNGPYSAVADGSGSYSTSTGGVVTDTAKSIQISG